MIKKSQAEREGCPEKTEGQGDKWNLFSRKRRSQLSALPLATKLPRASNSISPQLLCKTKVNTLEHRLPEVANDASRSNIPELVMLSAEKMLMRYLTPRVQRERATGPENK